MERRQHVATKNIIPKMRNARNTGKMEENMDNGGNIEKDKKKKRKNIVKKNKTKEEENGVKKGKGRKKENRREYI